MTALQFTLFVPGDSWVHRLDPVSKILITVVGLACTFLLPGHLAPALLLAASLALLATAGVLRRSAAVFAGVALIAVTFFVVQGLVYAGNEIPALTLGPVTFYREGLLLGLRLTLRLYNILASSLILILTTRPSDLVESLMRRGLPSRFGYVIIAVLQIIPTMVEASARITDAQRSRGMETEGSLWVRLRAFIPLMGPLVTSSLIATEERALALEVRGFASNRRPTFLNEETIPGCAWPVRIAVLAVLLLGIAGRVMLS